jgi:hypothetical protein
MFGPLSSYSCFEIHICWKVESEARIEPPIQTEYLRAKKNKRPFSDSPRRKTRRRIRSTHFLSGGATILTFIDAGARAVISLCIRSAERDEGNLVRMRPLEEERKKNGNEPIPEYIVVPPERTMFP